MLAESYRVMGLYSKAYKYFFKSRNEDKICECMEQVMKTAYSREYDIFIARACLEMLIKSTEIQKTRKIRERFARKVDPPTPILNFVDYLLECIELEEFEMVKQMANVDYAAEWKRDSSLYEKINTICEKYFDSTIKKQNQMQAMLSQMLGGMGGGGAKPGGGLGALGMGNALI